jgi:NADH:ubiquinone oxidoreductase subunit E
VVRITVCKKCGWSVARVRKTVQALAEAHPGVVEVRKKDCLDACDDAPAVRVGKRLLAPARPKAIRARVAARIAKRAAD